MKLDPDKQREFAAEVVRRLAERKYTAYWAGGCVRDSLLDRIPKDYDVATSALPDEVRDLFGRRRTHAVGAAFGVITVAGPPGAGHVEVATFRRDAPYSDGRHPDSVEYSSPVDDASRRDFTINGLFYNPLADEVIDLVGGRADLERGIVRAIGDPQARLAEDKLRMLRAVRFAATFGFQLEAETRAAVVAMAESLPVVSAERIAQEMRLMLRLPARALALRLLQEVGLLGVVLPEVSPLATSWQFTLSALDALANPSFPLALATVLQAAVSADSAAPAAGVATPNVALDQATAAAATAALQVCRRWKLSNKEQQRVVWLVRQQQSLRDAARQPWPRLQRLLIEPGILELLDLHQALAAAAGGPTVDVEYCRQCLQRSPEELNPPPLVSGHDLIRHGMLAGAAFQRLLQQIRDAQLEGQIASRDEALALATRLLASSDNTESR